MKFSVYILRTTSNKLYIGYSHDLEMGLKRHRDHDGARLLRNNESFKLIYSEEYQNQDEALKREKQLKGWTRAKKEVLIAKNLDLLKKI